MNDFKIFIQWCKRNYIFLFMIALFIFVAVFLIIGIIYIVEKYNKNNAKYIIALLNILFSWSVLGVLAFLIFITKFSVAINVFLKNSRLKTPYTEQEPQEEGNIKSEKRDQKEISNEIKSETEEFRYLALFFVDTTKRALKWFYDLKDKSIITYDSFNFVWQSIILDSGQRSTVFNVLQQNGMITGITGGAFSITEKGERFLKFINFI